MKAAVHHFVVQPFLTQLHAAQRELDDYFNRARALGISEQDAKAVLDFRMSEQAAKRNMTSRDALEQASRDLALSQFRD